MTLPALAPPDYAILPPEINSGRIYAGPGSTSLAASAAAWQALAAQLGSTASAFQAVVNGLAAGALAGAVLGEYGRRRRAVCGMDDGHRGAG